MKLYLNTNVYCRPFDDLKQEKVLKEAIASLKIFLLSLSKITSISISEIVLAEIGLIQQLSKNKKSN